MKKIIVPLMLLLIQTAYAADSGKLEMKEYTDEGIYYFYYPAVCDVKWDSKKGTTNVTGVGAVVTYSNRTISVRCPKDGTFKKYTVLYGSGDNFPGQQAHVYDDKTFTFAADSEWHTESVSYTPHDPVSKGSIWTNFKVVPLY